MDASEAFDDAAAAEELVLREGVKATNPRKRRAMDVFEAFDADAKELMLRQGIKASQLHERLRNITKAASEGLPPLQVLYGSYGGYGYNDAFKSFIKEKQAMPDSLVTNCALQSVSKYEYEYSDKARIRDAQSITQFGQHVMDRWPGIAKLVKAHMKNDLGHRMADIRLIQSMQKTLLKNQKRHDSIAAEKGRSDGKTEWSRYGDDSDLSVYAPSALEAMRTELEAEQNKLTVDIQEKRDGVLQHMTEKQYEVMLQSLDTKFPEEVEEPWYLKTFSVGFQNSIPSSRREYLPFTDTITKYGEGHHAVWKFQEYFDTHAMRFLLLHPEHTERLASEGHNVDCALRLGLCAASNYRCVLRIAEVPCLAEWKISEYDGMESIELA